MSRMKLTQRSLRRLIAAACAMFGTLTVAAPGWASNDVVLRWQDRFLSLTAQSNAFLVENGATVQADNPPEVSREMAMLNTSLFNAANAFGNRYQMYGSGPGVTPAAGASQEAAAIEAGRVAMRSMFPNTTRYPTRATQIDSIADGMYDELFDRGVSASAINAGKLVGASAANQILASRQNDGSGPSQTWADDLSYGKYRTDTFGSQTNVPAAEPQWGSQTPWVMTSGSQFRRNNIPAFTSPEYAAAIELTRIHGSKARYDAPNIDAQTAWEKRTAMFWAQKGLSPTGVKVATGTTTPPGQWLAVARTLAGERDDSLLEHARLMAMVSLAEADAGIAAWDTKFDPTNDLWRPIHAIRLAATPGDPNYNPGITRDENWNPLIPTSNHPEYVSGHSAFSGAAAQILSLYFGEHATFTVIGDDALWLDANGNIVDPSTPGATKEVRTYDSFWDAANEAGMSRIYGGIHYSFSNSDGLAMGKDIGNLIYASSLQLVPEPTALSVLTASAVLGLRRRRQLDIASERDAGQVSV